MAKCISCGKTIPDDFKFCGYCGAKQERTCPNCGAAVSGEMRFCGQCGTPLEPGAKPAPEAAKKRGRPPKAAQAAESTAVMGFYLSKSCRVAATDQMVVFSDHSFSIYRLDAEGTTASARICPEALCIREDGIWIFDLGNLMHLDGKLKQLSTQKLFAFEENGTRPVLSSRYLLCVQPAGEEGVSFYRYDLDSGEEREHALKARAFGADKIESIEERLLYGSTAYLKLGIWKTDENGEALYVNIWASVDTETWEAALLWNGADDDEPLFFDFARGIMWTHPRQGEMKRRGWEKSYDEKLRCTMTPLVARKIGYRQPILPSCPVWPRMPRAITCYFYYFDGKRAYYGPDYYHFYAIGQDGSVSEDWVQDLHGRVEETVVWKDRIIADLRAYYRFEIYPAAFEKPEKLMDWSSEES